MSSRTAGTSAARRAASGSPSARIVRPGRGRSPLDPARRRARVRYRGDARAPRPRVLLRRPSSCCPAARRSASTPTGSTCCVTSPATARRAERRPNIRPTAPTRVGPSRSRELLRARRRHRRAGVEWRARLSRRRRVPRLPQEALPGGHRYWAVTHPQRRPRAQGDLPARAGRRASRRARRALHRAAASRAGRRVARAQRTTSIVTRDVRHRAVPGTGGTRVRASSPRCSTACDVAGIAPVTAGAFLAEHPPRERCRCPRARGATAAATRYGSTT